MPNIFAVRCAYGPGRDWDRPLEEQRDWDAHARFMDGLVDDGFVVLGGPLAGTEEVLLIVRAADPAEIARRLAADPWHNDILRFVRADPWTLRLGTLDSAGPGS